jgi:hypothetical protein
MTHVPVVGPAGGFPQQTNQQQQFQQQQPIHPTVSYGQPGGQQAVIIPQGQPMPTAGQQPQQFQQQQQTPQPQAPQQPAPGTFPSGQQPPWPQQSRQTVQGQPIQRQPNVVIPDNMVLDGDNIPPELRGKTFGQLKTIYGELATSYLQQPGRTPAPRPNNITQQQPQVQQQPQTQGQNQEPTFWQDPDGAINRAVQRNLAPIQQQTLQQQIRETGTAIKSQIADYNVIEAELLSTLSNIQDPNMLADPEIWRNTARLVRGRMLEEGRYNPQQQQQPASGYSNQPNNTVPSQQQVQRGPGVFQPANAFFTEQPTAPMGNNFVGGQGGFQYELTVEQKEIARKMQMSEQEYKDWSVGFQRPDQTRRW